VGARSSPPGSASTATAKAETPEPSTDPTALVQPADTSGTSSEGENAIKELKTTFNQYYFADWWSQYNYSVYATQTLQHKLQNPRALFLLRAAHVPLPETTAKQNNNIAPSLNLIGNSLCPG